MWCRFGGTSKQWSQDTRCENNTAIPEPRTVGIVLLVATVAAVEVTWTRQFGPAVSVQVQGDFAKAIDVSADSSGNVYLMGRVGGAFEGFDNDFTGMEDGFIRKYDGNGNELWTRQFGPQGQTTATSDVVLDQAGNQYVVGSTNGTLPGQTYAGQGDAFVIKYDSNGNLVWTRQFGTVDYDRNSAIALGPDGNIYIVGETNGTLSSQTSTGGQDGYLRKYDVVGNEVWTRQFGTTGLDLARGVASDSAGNVYVAGRTTGVFSGQSTVGGGDATVLSFDSEGNRRWTHQFGTAGSDSAVGIAVIASSVFVVGNTSGTLPGQNSGGGSDTFLRRYDISGNEVWTEQFGSSSDDDSRAVHAGMAGVFTV
mgnify:CR=1 FL=1